MFDGTRHGGRATQPTASRTRGWAARNDRTRPIDRLRLVLEEQVPGPGETVDLGRGEPPHPFVEERLVEDEVLHAPARSASGSIAAEGGDPGPTRSARSCGRRAGAGCPGRTGGWRSGWPRSHKGRRRRRARLDGIRRVLQPIQVVPRTKRFSPRTSQAPAGESRKIDRAGGTTCPPACGTPPCC